MIIERDKERIKRTNEIFTPTSLVNQLLDQFPEEAFTHLKETFCDPTCGDGQFLVEVLKRKLNGGLSPSDAIKSIYGVDYMEDNIKLCKKRIKKILSDHHEACGKGRKLPGNVNNMIERNIICSDFFEWDFENWRAKDDAKHKRLKSLVSY